MRLDFEIAKSQIIILRRNQLFFLFYGIKSCRSELLHIKELTAFNKDLVATTVREFIDHVSLLFMINVSISLYVVLLKELSHLSIFLVESWEVVARNQVTSLWPWQLYHSMFAVAPP